jgi:hypothetical protein
LILNHELGTKLVEQPFEVLEAEAEAGEPVSVGNHNRADSARKDGIQKGLKSRPFEVEPRPDVDEDVDVGVGAKTLAGKGLEAGLLGGSVWELLARRNTGVHGNGAAVGGARARGVSSGAGSNLLYVDAPVSTAGEGALQFAAKSPFPDGLLAHAIVPSCGGSRQERNAGRPLHPSGCCQYIVMRGKNAQKKK